MMCAEDDSEKKRSSIEFSISARGSSILTVLKSASASSIWKSMEGETSIESSKPSPDAK